MNKLSDVILAACAVAVTLSIVSVSAVTIKQLTAEEYAEAPACVVTGDGRGQKG